MYVADVVLLTVAGIQVPVIELFDVGGKIGLAEPEHIDAMAVKVGVTFEFTTIVKFAGVAH